MAHGRARVWLRALVQVGGRSVVHGGRPGAEDKGFEPEVDRDRPSRQQIVESPAIDYHSLPLSQAAIWVYEC